MTRADEGMVAGKAEADGQKFTAGPWGRPAKFPNEYRIYSQDGDTLLALVYSEANAHLIASAPLIHTGLRKVRTWLETLPGCDSRIEAIEYVSEILAKAEGRDA